MSKAIYGHLLAGDAELLAEITRLRRRVSELEEQVAAYEAALHTDLVVLGTDDLDVALRTLSSSEHALT